MFGARADGAGVGALHGAQELGPDASRVVGDVAGELVELVLGLVQCG